MIEPVTILWLKNGNGGSAAALPGFSRILTRHRRGDVSRRKQVVALYDELRLSLFGYLCCVGLKSDEAEDVIQETFLRLFRDFESELIIDHVRPWAFRVAQHVAVDEHRKQNLLLNIEGDVERLIYLRAHPSPNPEESLAQKEQTERLAAAALKLTPQQRQCLHMRAEGLRYREIAAVLGISTQRVAVLIERALAHLAGQI